MEKAQFLSHISPRLGKHNPTDPSQNTVFKSVRLKQKVEKETNHRAVAAKVVRESYVRSIPHAANGRSQHRMQ